MKWMVITFCIAFITACLAGCAGNPAVVENLKTSTAFPEGTATKTPLPVVSLTPAFTFTPTRVPYLFEFESDLRTIGIPHYAPDGMFLFLPSTFGVLVMDSTSYRVVERLASTSGFVNDIALSPEEKMFVYGSEGLVTFAELVSWTDGNALSSPEILGKLPDRNLVRGAKFSPNGTFLSVGYSSHIINFWSMKNGEFMYSLQADRVDFSPDESLMVIVSNSDDSAHLELYETETGRQLKQWAGERSVFLPDNRLAVETNGATRVYDLSNGTVSAAFSGRFASFSPDGRLIAFLYQDRVEIRQVSDGKLIATLEGDFQYVQGDFTNVYSMELRFSPDGKSLVGDANWLYCCGGSAEKMFLWRVEDGELLQQIGNPSGFDFSPDGSSLSITTGHTLEIWNTADGTVRETFDSLLIP